MLRDSFLSVDQFGLHDRDSSPLHFEINPNGVTPLSNTNKDNSILPRTLYTIECSLERFPSLSVTAVNSPHLTHLENLIYFKNFEQLVIESDSSI